MVAMQHKNDDDAVATLQDIKTTGANIRKLFSTANWKILQLLFFTLSYAHP